MSISVLNTDAGLSGKTIANLEDAQNVTGLKSFNRSPNAPFAVQAASAVVPNLIAESLSGGSVTATTGTFSSTLGVTGLITGRDVTVVTSTTTGATNNWAPGIAVGTTLLEWSGTTTLPVTGLDGGSSGCVVIIKNLSTGADDYITFAHASGSSDADNRFTNIATSGATPVAPGGYAVYVHDGTNWKLVAHDQGAWITPTFAAGDYTASGAGTWTVASGDVTTQIYKLVGKQMSVVWYLASTTVARSGGDPTSLILGNTLWGGFTTTNTSLNPMMFNDNGAGNTLGYAQAGAGGTTIILAQLAATQWANATNTTNLFGQMTFQVT